MCISSTSIPLYGYICARQHDAAYTLSDFFELKTCTNSTQMFEIPTKSSKPFSSQKLLTDTNFSNKFTCSMYRVATVQSGLTSEFGVGSQILGAEASGDIFHTHSQLRTSGSRFCKVCVVEHSSTGPRCLDTTKYMLETWRLCHSSTETTFGMCDSKPWCKLCCLTNRRPITAMSNHTMHGFSYWRLKLESLQTLIRAYYLSRFHFRHFSIAVYLQVFNGRNSL